MKRPTIGSRGLMLVELAVAMMVAGGLLVVVATLFAKVIAANAAAADHLHGIVALSDLGRQFRGDVRSAVSSEISEADDQPPILSLILSDGSRVEYSATSSGLRRTQTAADLPQRRDAFVLQGTRVLRFEADTDHQGAISIVLARVTRRPGMDDAMGGEFAITAIAPLEPAKETDE